MATVSGWGLTSMLRRLQHSKDQWMLWFKNTTVKIIVIFLLVTLQLWVSVFLYGSFYYAYMPTLAHLKPVFLQFTSTCENFSGNEQCPFPHSNTTLVKSPYTNLLMKGQRYKVTLELEMPQSPVNEDLGVFMARLEFMTFKGEPVAHSTRPAMLRFRSPILKLMEVVVFSPLLITGYSEEKQHLSVTLLEDFIDNSYKPVVSAFVELQARRIQLYSAVLKIQAHFTGLRFFMYYWPVASSAIGIGSFFLLLSIFTMLSWQQCAAGFWRNPEPEDDIPPVRFTQPRPVTYEERRSIIKRNMEQERLNLFQSRPQHVTVGSAESDTIEPLRTSSSEPSLTQMGEEPSDSKPTVEQVESLGLGEETQGASSEFPDMTSEKASVDDTVEGDTIEHIETKSSQCDKGSESSDETHGFEKLEKDEGLIHVANLTTAEGESKNTGVQRKGDLETLGLGSTSELRYRAGHGETQTQ